MYCMNISKLNGVIAEKNTTKEALADAIGADRSTLFRRIKAGKLTITDIHKICDFLGLTRGEAMEIFLAQ